MSTVRKSNAQVNSEFPRLHKEADAETEQAPKLMLTDMGNAERLVALHGKDLRYCHPWSMSFEWDGRRWAMDNTAGVVRRMKEAVRRIYREAAEVEDDDERKTIAKWAKASESRSRIDSGMYLARSEAGIPILHGDMDQNPWLLNVQNGTVDLRTGELREHRRDDLISQPRPGRI